MTAAEIRAVEQVAVSPAQRLIVALAAVHAARPAAIRELTLDDLDPPNKLARSGMRLNYRPPGHPADGQAA